MARADAAKETADPERRPVESVSFAFDPARRRRVLCGIGRRAGRIDVVGEGARVAFDTAIAADGPATSLALAPEAPLGAGDADAVFAVLEFLFARDTGLDSLKLAGPHWRGVLPALLARGLAIRDGDAEPRALASMVWQIRSGWMPGGASPFPAAHVAAATSRHPRRPPLLDGTLYARFIPWLKGVLTFETAAAADLPCLHRWLNDPRVDRFWRESGDLARHRAYLEAQRSDPHTWPLIARFEGEAFGYFEIYWARESLVGPFYDAGDHDRGWHVLIGDEAFRGRRWVAAWLPSLMHLIFLDDPRTDRIVGEPEADHEAQLRNLSRSGFERLGTIDLPKKRAALVSLSRRRFFEDRLWHPAWADSPATP